jgi:hypothetical protein
VAAGEPLSLERYASICALVDAGRKRDEVLQGASLSPERWMEEQGSWLERMAAQARRQRFELQRRFNDLYLERLEALAVGESVEVAEGIALDVGDSTAAEWTEERSGEPVASSRRARVIEADAPPPSVHASVPPPPPPPPPAVAPVSVGPASSVEPRTLTSPPPPVQRGDSVLPFGGAPASRGPQPPGSPPQDYALPFRSREPEPGPAPAAPRPPAGTSGVSGVTETQDERLFPSAGPALPFRRDPQRADESPRRSPPPPDRRVMPFAPAPGEGQGAPIPPPAPAVEASESESPPKRDLLSSTITFEGGPTGPSLPFAAMAKGMASADQSAAPVDDGVLPFHALERPSKGSSSSPPPKEDETVTNDLAGTVMMDEGLGVEEPRLTLGQFASLTAEIARSPDDRDTIERRYGLDAALHDAEKRAWAARFLREPRLADDYRSKLATYRQWLDSQGR